ncbi:hypothetical protein [Flavobacterium crassostreae]|uniref:Uncharacterized protein n=1 Tax=Flavobacterium crassostreae TaxID=1763534 RepID=A0A1B9E8Z3_9FLAO|nr:hypothetical protein [Flavobacterium crassostreae]OCB78415.1 hypothetical protein LPBF_02500 [Flavobacterium crassostreae]
MESKTINQDFKLTIQSGGMIEFRETGIIPRFLVFHSRELRRTWRFKQTKDTQNGVLKVNGQVAFYYFFDGLGCKMKSVANGVIGAEWEIEEVVMELRD